MTVNYKVVDLVKFNLRVGQSFGELCNLVLKSPSIVGIFCEELLLLDDTERFIRFASLEYNGKIYMTPRDFLDSVTEELPRCKI